MASETTPQELLQIAETARAFDSVAAEYDGPSGNNALVQIMRAELQRAVLERVPRGARLLDLGCGTGIDAAWFAQHGYTVTAVDASREMVHQTRQRATRANLEERVRVQYIGAHELERLGTERFDAIYSDLGPLNCVADLRAVSEQCAAHLNPGGILVFSVMARYCPWEMLYHTLRGDFNAARRRFPRGALPVKLNDGIVWTRYYSPREFFQLFENEFQLVTYRALNLFLPPPYLIRWYERFRTPMRLLSRLDSTLDGVPLLREAGDHFLITLRRKA
ncbi:MAG: methyltransferase domain-containing protein [Chloroflexi bacterium]|nr:methyltransferase domain-containing protein [Chloroflexota bacterium]